jgi:enoyl-[acyl-carrier protein] reductase II
MAAVEGDLKKGSFLSGQVAGMVKKEQSAAEIVEELMGEGAAILMGASKWVK